MRLDEPARVATALVPAEPVAFMTRVDRLQPAGTDVFLSGPVATTRNLAALVLWLE